VSAASTARRRRRGAPAARGPKRAALVRSASDLVVGHEPPLGNFWARNPWDLQQAKLDA
jgi:hypothetical protein